MVQRCAQFRECGCGQSAFQPVGERFARLAGNAARGQPVFQPETWRGEWTEAETNYDVHVAFNGEDKYMTAKAEALRLSLKDGKNLLIFDRAD